MLLARGARTCLFVLSCFFANNVLQECQAWMTSTTTRWPYSTRQVGGRCSRNTSRGRNPLAVLCHMVAPQQLGTFEPLTLSPPSAASSAAAFMDAQEIQQDDRYVILEDFVSAPTPPPPAAAKASNGISGSSSDLWIPKQKSRQTLLLPFQQGWDIQKELSIEHRQRLDRLGLLHQTAAGPAEKTLLSPFLDKKTATEWLQQEQRSVAMPTEQIQPLTLMQPQQQQQQRQERDILRGGLDTILFVQHEPVYTLGSGSDESLILNNANDNDENNIPIVRMNRGGEVTYHGPGMLVVYPVLDLRNYRKDIHWYMRALEEAVLLALQDVGIQGAVRDEETTGVWIRGNDKDNDDLYKVAAIGIHCRQWITQHGLAINVEHSPSFERAFKGIVPCGLHGRKVGCVNQFLDEKHAITLEQMARSMVAALEEVFQIKLVKRPLL